MHHASGKPEHFIDVPKSTFQFASTPGLTDSIDVVPPTPPLEDVESATDASIRGGIQEDYGFPDVAQVVGVDSESTATSLLRTRSPFENYEENFTPCKVERVQHPAHEHRRKALLIGIKYDGVNAPVEGAHNDVEDMKNFLIDHYEWLEDDITILKDDGHITAQPTRENIMLEMKQLVLDARTGDRLFFHFSGHGGQVIDTDGDEADGLDEVIFSCDKRPILDDELHDVLVKPLPAGCRLTALFDCCSSGTGLDLPVMESSSPGVHLSAMLTPLSLGGQADEQKVSTMIGDGSMLDLPHQYPSMTPQSSSTPETRSGAGIEPVRQEPRPKGSAGDVILWSSCQDSERSYEVVASADLRMKGAMTHAFIESLKDRKQQTYRELLDSLHESLALWGCPQKPTMSSAHRLNMRDIVSI